MHRMTAWRHYNAGTLPPELQPKKIGNIIYVLANPEGPTGRVVGCARVSSAKQATHPENQANRPWAYAGLKGILLDHVVSDIANGLNDLSPRLRQLLGDPTVQTIIPYDHRRASGAVGPVWRGHGGSHAGGPGRLADGD